MARITTTYVDGWPLMKPLGRRESWMLRRNLDASEVILGQVIGMYGQAVVATTAKVTIVKSGISAGRVLGASHADFHYDQLDGVEVRHSIAMGELELLDRSAPARPDIPGGFQLRLSERPNGVIYTKLEWTQFDAMAEKLRELMEHPPTPVASAAEQPNSEEDADSAVEPASRHGTMENSVADEGSPDESSVEDKLANLAKLHQKGVISFSEYSRAKVEILTGKRPRKGFW